MSVGARSAPICHFFKNAIKSEPLVVRGEYIQDFHISMLPTTGENLKTIREVRVTFPG